MAWAGAVVSLIGGAKSASGQRRSGRDAQAAYNMNAAISNQNAVRAKESADQDILSLKRNAYQVIGAQRAAYAASGVSGTSGSALDILADSASQAVLDQQRRAYHGELEAQDFRNQAAMGIAAGISTRRGADASASGQLLSSVGDVVSKVNIK